MPWRSDDLLTSVRVGLVLPDADDRFTSANLLSMADEQTTRVLVPWVVAKRGENYWVTSADQTIVAGTSGYRIPTRALGQALRDVCLVDSLGHEISVPEIPLERVGEFQQSASAYWPHAVGFYTQGDKVELLPTPVSGSTWTTLRLKYRRRPSRLVLAASAFAITSIGTSPDRILGVVPSTWTTSNTFDSIEWNPGFDVLQADFSATTVNVGTSLVLASAPTGGVAASDYVALAGETPVVQLPAELHPILAALTRSDVLVALKELAAADYVRSQALRDLEAMKPLVRPRVDGEDRRTVNPNSPLRVGRAR